MARMINTLNFIENLRLRSFALFQSRSARRQSTLKFAAVAVAVLLVSVTGAEPAYAQLLLPMQSRVHNYVIAGEGTAQEALDGLVADWTEVFIEEGKL